jgi:hypothetical protein
MPLSDEVNDLAATIGADVKASLAGKVNAATGQSITLWKGTQAAYEALSSGVKNADGFIAVIRG